MKKKLIMGMVVLSALVLASCGNDDGTTKEAIDVSVESKSSENNEPSNAGKSENEKTDYNQEITDDENIKITLLGIEKVVDKDFDEEKYVISFDVTNKREHTVEIQAREVSLNDRMVDESLLMMSTEIAGGKSATAKLEIQDYSGEELPALEGNLELILHTFDWDTMEYEHDVPVSVAIK